MEKSGLPSRFGRGQLTRFFAGVLRLVNAKIAHREPENQLGFIFTEDALKLAFKCSQGDGRTCSWEAIKFFAKWQLAKIERGFPMFGVGIMEGPERWFIEYIFGETSSIGIYRSPSASDFEGLRHPHFP
ncbi:hypothetical protein Q9189_007416 [Teloschistes chrysophthalmus]